MKEEWLFPGAVVPVDVETTAALVDEIKRLIHVVGGMALLQPEPEWVGLTDEEIVSTLRRDDIKLTHFCAFIQSKDFTNDYLTRVVTLLMEQEGFYFARAIEEKLKDKNT